MTVRCYIHSIAKRAETIALVDSGATENFMNLTYARWLRLPIKQLARPRKLFNVDGTKNQNGEVKFYTDLQVQTGSTRTQLRFLLKTNRVGEIKRTRARGSRLDVMLSGRACGTITMCIT